MGHLRPWAISDSFNNEDFIDEIDGLGEALADYYYKKTLLQRFWSWMIGEAMIIHKILNAADDFYFQNRNQDRAAAWTFFQKFERLAHRNNHGAFTTLRQELTDLLAQQLELFAIQAQTNYAKFVGTGFKKGAGSSPKSARAASAPDAPPTKGNHWWSKKPAPIVTTLPPAPQPPALSSNTWWKTTGPSLKDSVMTFTLACKQERASNGSSKSSSRSSSTPSLVRVQS